MGDDSHLGIEEQDDLNTGRSQFLLEFVKNHKLEQIFEILRNMKSIKVLVIGDAIIDEYAYGEVIERAKKEPILVFKYKYSDLFAGGAFAIANHAAQFSDNVTLLTCTGDDETTKKFLGEKINVGIDKRIFIEKNQPTLVKRRYVETYRPHKIFETYNKEPELLSLPEREILECLNENIKKFDVVIMADFGHGLITDSIKDLICNNANYLAVNVQTNSGNLGFNLITKIQKSNLIFLTKEELQLAFHDRKSDLRILVKKLKDVANCNRIGITLGKFGILYFNDGDFYQVPALADKVVDTVGAGDAVFSIASLASFQNVSGELVPFIGNCAGALAVRILGNKEPVKPDQIIEFANNLFPQR